MLQSPTCPCTEQTAHMGLPHTGLSLQAQLVLALKISYEDINNFHKLQTKSFYCLIIHFYKEFYQRNICKPEIQSLFLDKLYLLTRQNRLRNSTHTCIICVLFHAHVLEQKAHLTKSCFGCRGTNWLPVLYTYGMVVSNICLIF